LTVDLRDADERSRLVDLIRHADVLVHSFRPGAMGRYGLDHDTISTVNPRLVYAHVTGYGADGPWSKLPGQDLLVQARTGLVWLNGRDGEPPAPFGLSVVDHLAGTLLVQGILACLVRRGITGRGGLVEVSLLEAAMDLQFEVFTSYLNDGGPPTRSAVSAGHPDIGAPYGIYRTSDGWLALAMGPLDLLADLVDLPGDRTRIAVTPFADRDEFKQRLVEVLVRRTTEEWMAVLEPAGYWCAEVRDWPALEESGALDALRLVIDCGDHDRSFKTTRCPVRIDGEPLPGSGPGPKLGAHAPLPTHR
jgi:CoA:oxalate CoA-transferase